MFFLSLLLLGQSAGLDADTGKAASECATIYAAGFARTGKADIVHGVSQMTYLSMAAARAEGLRGSAFLYRAVAMLQAFKPPIHTGKTVASPADCDKRFPFARTTVPATLPQDSADRDILCFWALSLVARSVENSPRRSAEVTPLVTRFTERLALALKAKDVSPADKEIALGDAMHASLDLGNIESIALSCRELPA